MMSKLPVKQAPAKTAGALHNRVKSPHVVDLRGQAPIPVTEGLPLTAVERSEARPPAATPKSPIEERHMAQFTDRFERARQYGRSAQISRFGVDRFGNIQDPEKYHDKFGNPTLAALERTEGSSGAPASSHESHIGHAPTTASAKAPEMPHLAAMQHEAMTKLAPAPQPQMAMSRAPMRMSWAPHFKVTPHTGRSLATISVVVLMAGYIWIQNYPKMALQNASNVAGLSASLPGFMPSSYSLAHTSTVPGQVTLKYTSPSAQQALKIAQSRSDWDSNSLLDDFVSKNADDYAAVDGEGLTIFLFNDNEATWVNHGIWYSIEGASRLSRQQILKIAYSL
ncbi:MAG TPA: hypothetical protein VMS08_03230 [Candidatus Saccharimonadia bacterium]|nr:hypothetical protein [Candidatus Saccharimonadia bacterium]